MDLKPGEQYKNTFHATYVAFTLCLRGIRKSELDAIVSKQVKRPEQIYDSLRRGHYPYVHNARCGHIGRGIRLGTRQHTYTWKFHDEVRGDGERWFSITDYSRL
jgi:hypothetical protein